VAWPGVSLKPQTPVCPWFTGPGGQPPPGPPLQSSATRLGTARTGRDVYSGVNRSVWPFQRFWQLDDIDGDPPSLIAREQSGSPSPAGLVLTIDIRQCLRYRP